MTTPTLWIGLLPLPRPLGVVAVTVAVSTVWWWRTRQALGQASSHPLSAGHHVACPRPAHVEDDHGHDQEPGPVTS